MLFILLAVVQILPSPLLLSKILDPVLVEFSITEHCFPPIQSIESSTTLCLKIYITISICMELRSSIKVKGRPASLYQETQMICDCSPPDPAP